MMVQLLVLALGVVHVSWSVLSVDAALNTVPMGRGLTVVVSSTRVPPPCTLMLGSAAAGVIAVTVGVDATCALGAQGNRTSPITTAAVAATIVSGQRLPRRRRCSERS